MKKTDKISNLEKLATLADFFGYSWYLGKYAGKYHFNSYNKKDIRVISLSAKSPSGLAKLLRLEVDQLAIKPLQKKKVIKKTKK